MKSENSSLYPDTDHLLDYGYEAFRSVEIQVSDYESTVPITDETAVIGEATVTLKEPIMVSLNTDQALSAITYKTNITESLNESTVPGDVVGTTGLFIGDELIIYADVVLQKIHLDSKKNIDHQKEELSEAKSNPFLIVLIFAFILLISVIYHHLQPTSHYSKYAGRKR